MTEPTTTGAAIVGAVVRTAVEATAVPLPSAVASQSSSLGVPGRALVGFHARRVARESVIAELDRRSHVLNDALTKRAIVALDEHHLDAVLELFRQHDDAAGRFTDPRRVQHLEDMLWARVRDLVSVTTTSVKNVMG